MAVNQTALPLRPSTDMSREDLEDTIDTFTNECLAPAVGSSEVEMTKTASGQAERSSSSPPQTADESI